MTQQAFSCLVCALSEAKGMIKTMSCNTIYEPADIVIHVQGKGIVAREKSLVAFRKSDNKIVAVGTEASVWRR